MLKTKMIKNKILALFVMLTIILTAVSVSFVNLVSGAAAYNDYVEAAAIDNGLKIDPVTVVEVNSSADLDSLATAQVPSDIVMMKIDKDMKVKLNQETKSFTEVFNDTIKGKSIPALYIDTEAVAEAFITYMKDTYYIKDIMVISPEFDVLEMIYSDDVCYIVNTIYDLTDITLSSNRYDFWTYIGSANTVGCNILMVNGMDKNLSTVAEYVSAMTKTCWAYIGDGDDSDIVSAIASGSIGIVGNNLETLQDGIKVFENDGFARAQFVAAHRGITAYANENSLTSVAASANEGATHVEVDLQVTSDGRIILAHDSDAGMTSTAPNSTWFAIKSLGELRGYNLNSYSETYNEKFPTLEEIVEAVIDTDLILILELKLDDASDLAANTLNCINAMYDIMCRYKQMEGRWFTITFYAPYAVKMRTICPEIPVGFLGAGIANGNNDGGSDDVIDDYEIWQGVPASTSAKNYIPFLRKNNLVMDITKSENLYSASRQFVVRGYMINTWTYGDTTHFSTGINIATTDTAEKCAMLVKYIAESNEIRATKAQLNSGNLSAECTTYNGWKINYSCKIVYLDGNPNTDSEVKAVLYYTSAANLYGIYSNLITVKVV